MNLDEGVQIKRLCFGVKLGEVVGIESGDDQEDRIGAEDRRLDELVGVDDEVLAQDRQT